MIVHESKGIQNTAADQDVPSTGGWDFSAALALIQSLTIAAAPQPLSIKAEEALQASSAVDNQEENRIPRLGDFDAVWKLLGHSQARDGQPASGLHVDTEPKIGALSTPWASERKVPAKPDTGGVEHDFGASDSCRERGHLNKEPFDTNRETADSDSIPEQDAQDGSVHTSSALDQKRRAIIYDIVGLKESLREGIKGQEKLQSKAIAATSQAKSNSNVFANADYAAAKRSRLVISLLQDFPKEADSLRRLGKSVSACDEQGIHVFIDMSNILIGFHDALKIQMGLSKEAHLRRQRLSFYNLALILERGRTAAKRVLVGSDELESVQDARTQGYEVNILERVLKTARPRTRAGASSNGKGPVEFSSGSDSASNTTGPRRRVEQAVDEILHLKIAQSVLDVLQPSTMILATGDAAAAEYSDGFLRMIERALLRGWHVELVAFRANTSAAYRAAAWKQRWGEAFSIVELDSYTDYLHAS